MAAQRFEMLVELYGDGATSDILSEQALIRSWLRVEAALATAQAELGVLDREHAEAISAASTLRNISSPVHSRSALRLELDRNRCKDYSVAGSC